MDISVAVPNDLVDASNGKFTGKTDLGDGYTRWDWHVHYPINSYNVSLNIGNYVHFADTLGDLPLDFYVTSENLDKAKTQFVQAKPMIEAFQKYFGEYPFKKDGYKLIEAPYSGMEHQSAVTYGNHFANGYLERDWTGVGISLKFDFIIIHESAHEWFGNAISAADVSDMRGAPPSFAEFHVGDRSRTPVQIVAHIGDLFDWALSLAKGAQAWHNSTPLPWDEEVARFFATVGRFDAFLASETPLSAPPEQLFQGPVADALNHVGQIAMLRRLAGAPIRGENYAKADIVAGRTGAQQTEPRLEFD